MPDTQPARQWRTRSRRSQCAPCHRRLQDRRAQADLLRTAQAVAGLAGAEAARRGPHRHDRRHRQCLRHQRKVRDRSCWRARTSKARTTPAGSTARSASSTRSKRRACSMPIPSLERRGRGRRLVRRGRTLWHFLGSRSYVGHVTEADIDAARDRTSGRTMRDALTDMGLAGRPRVAAEPGRHVGYLEAHIEQGDTLESGRLAIGVVTSIVGIWQYQINFVGEQNHAGTTRMAARKDAGPGAGQVLRGHRRAFPGRLRPAHGLDHRPHHARSGRAEHHSGRGRNAVPDPRRRSVRHRAAGKAAAERWRTRSARTAPAPSPWRSCAPARPP